MTAGLDMVQRQLHEILAKHGVEPIEAHGRPFDPNLHDAVMQQPSREHPEGTVVSELSKGYTIRERVLRPSKVAVSAKPRRGLIDESAAALARLPGLTRVVRARACQAVPSERVNTMPTYDYICDACGHEFEIFEPITSTPRDGLSGVQGAQAAEKDRCRSGDPLQGIWFLPDRLSQRVVQEGRAGGQGVERAGEAGERFEIERVEAGESTSSTKSEPAKTGPAPKSDYMMKVTLSDLFEEPARSRRWRIFLRFRSAASAAGWSTWGDGLTGLMRFRAARRGASLRVGRVRRTERRGEAETGG